MFEHAEVLRDGRLGDAEGSGELADSVGPKAQALEQLPSGAVAQGLER